jgi:site-specific DNA recombinase
MSPSAHSRAVLYLRVSTASQVEHGTSLDEQRRDLLAYAERHRLEVVEVIEDAGESAANLERPGMVRALELIESGEADLFVATKIDRVARNLRDLLNIAHELRERDASIVLADDTLDTTTAQGRLYAQMMGAFAEWERELIASRLQAGRDAARARGVRFGRPPVGMTAKRGKLAVAENGAERIALAKRAASMKASGSTLQAIAETFNGEGIATGSNRPGTSWHPSSVSRLLVAARALAAIA